MDCRIYVASNLFKEVYHYVKIASLFVLLQVHKLCFNSLEETEQCLAISGGTETCGVSARN